MKEQKLTPLNSNEMMQISAALEAHDAIFYKFWNLGRPYFSESIGTAGVQFDKDGKYIQFILNENFWNNLSFEEKKFVICHESLHIIFDHGSRFFGLNPTLANYAADIVINHALVNRFAFIRGDIDPKNAYCWVDKFFDDSIQDDMNFEYYYNLLINKENLKPNTGGEGEPEIGEGSETVDEHTFPMDSSEAMDALGKSLTPEEKQAIKSFIQEHKQSDDLKAGSGAGNSWLDVSDVKVATKKKWETVINKWAHKFLTDEYKQSEQWARLNRRMTMLPSDMFLPSDMEIDEREMDDKKIDVWFFQDTSGSCVHLAKRFFAAARSLPLTRFNVRLFCFDTEVYETSLATGKIYGGGGTTFTCIEKAIQRILIKEKIKYPDSVWVVTDGAGNIVKPQYPKQWFWFLSSNYKSCIPVESTIYMLKDFE